MKEHALVLGKFMPLHLGHLALIDFAQSQAKKVTVLLCVEPTEPIPGDDRERWLRETYRGRKDINVQRFNFLDADLPSTSVSNRNVSARWTHQLKLLVPTTDILIGSEPYVKFVAEYWGINYSIYDEDRLAVPISATDIREKPYPNRHLIAPAARPDFVQGIVLHGTESTGKTSMAELLANRYQTNFVPETARELIGHTKSVTYDHLFQIANRQARAIREGLRKADGVLFIDTDVYSTLAYSRYIFGRELPLQPHWLSAAQSDLCLFFLPDAPYVQDGTRLNLPDRADLHAQHLRARQESGIQTEWIGGKDWRRRQELAERLVRKFLL